MKFYKIHIFLAENFLRFLGSKKGSRPGGPGSDGNWRKDTRNRKLCVLQYKSFLSQGKINVKGITKLSHKNS